MPRCHLKRTWVGAMIALLLTVSGGTAFTQTVSTRAAYAFKVTSVNPTSFNPTTGARVTVYYTVPTRCDFRIYIANSAGAEIRSIARYVNVSASNRTATWDGKDSRGAYVANGTYAIVIRATNADATRVAAAQGRVTVTTGSASQPPTSTAYTITGITPSAFDPGKGERATINYTVPRTSDYRVTVTNSAGSLVRTLASYTGMSSGSKTLTWDGKNSSGANVPAGVYAVNVQGINSYATTITAAKASVTVRSSAPTTYAFAISNINPATINVSQGQTTIVTYTVPTACNLRVYITNSAGTEICTLATVNGASAGTRTATWNGRNASGATVASGTYTVHVASTSATPAITAARGTVTVTTNTVVTPPATGAEKGQIIEGQGSANFAWLRYAGRKLGVGFKAPKTGTLREITLQWKKSSGYGAGTYGRYNFEIHTNGAGNFASGTVIGRATNIDPRTAMDGYLDGALHFNITANLTAGQIYHLVVSNVDGNPSANWSSPNGLMTRVQPWDGTGNRAAVYENGTWRPWSSQNNPWNTGGSNYVNGQHIPTMLSYTDGTNYGDHYYSARTSAPARFYGANKAGQYIVWNQPSTTISRIGISVRKNGNPGALLYHLERIGSGDIASGTVNTSTVSAGAPGWAYATLSSPATLQQGASYRLWFESPSSSSSSHFSSAWVYGEQRPASWLEAGWGGTQSYYTQSSGSSWTAYKNGDLSFSLQ